MGTSGKYVYVLVSLDKARYAKLSSNSILYEPGTVARDVILLPPPKKPCDVRSWVLGFGFRICNLQQQTFTPWMPPKALNQALATLWRKCWNKCQREKATIASGPSASKKCFPIRTTEILGRELWAFRPLCYPTKA